MKMRNAGLAPGSNERMILDLGGAERFIAFMEFDLQQNRENGVVLVRVYVSHPLRGNVEANRGRVDEICRRISEEHPDVTILSPIHNFGYVSPLGPQEWVLSQCRGLLHAADELWLFGEWERSEGCLMELACALEMGIPVRHIPVEG